MVLGANYYLSGEVLLTVERSSINLHSVALSVPPTQPQGELTTLLAHTAVLKWHASLFADTTYQLFETSVLASYYYRQ